MWKTGLFEVKHCFGGSGFVYFCCEWKTTLIYVVNVYISGLTVVKREVWDAILSLKHQGNCGDWGVTGDFNVVSSLKERQGNNAHLRMLDMNEFNLFITDMELVDFLYMESCSLGIVQMDCLEVVWATLLSDGLTSTWKISGHCPIWLSCSSKDWVLKPFHLFNG